jgi:DNA mismatch repair protein MutL
MSMERTHQVHLLDPLVAQRIAAGEVIERPASVVRELIDNAVDAGAKHITIQISEGGIERITVIDDGQGIQVDDLPLCCRSHATSKVTTLEDLYHLSTMGFRGEALYSIAASAKVTIASRYALQQPATIVVDNGREYPVTPGGPDRGTKVDVEHLFSAIPARRLFLKRPGTEASMIRKTIVEKALAFPEISFTYYDGNTQKLDLPATTAKQRVLDALKGDQHVVLSEMTELSDQASRFSLYAVASTPASYRSDRSHIRIYINRRPIEEFALVQAITYGYGETLPGGAFPYCYLFVTVDPELVDFNIHPAKREAKLRNKAEIHHQVAVMVRQQIQKSLPRLNTDTRVTQQAFGYSEVRESARPADDWFSRAREILTKTQSPATDTTPHQYDDFQYIGQVFSLFLVVQKGESLYLIDQHAAHERILYDQIRHDGGVQNLMVPLSFEVERSIDDFLQEHHSWYATYGLKLKRIDDLQWELTSIPALWKPIEQQVVQFICSHATGDIAELEKRLYATIACHDAIKDGDAIDESTAHALIRQVFALEHPVCPHGRTFVVEITRSQLFQSVGRIL